MAIIVWLAVIAFISVILGEVFYAHSKNVQNDGRNGLNNISNISEEYVDCSFGNLSIEEPKRKVVFSQTIAARGSWRIAQNNVESLRSFEGLRDEEYSKKL